jgi:hypothetical protein
MRDRKQLTGSIMFAFRAYFLNQAGAAVIASLHSNHEAAVIRYLINEGLSEKMWPPISRRIEEEANWAFFV